MHMIIYIYIYCISNYYHLIIIVIYTPREGGRPKLGTKKQSGQASASLHRPKKMIHLEAGDPGRISTSHRKTTEMFMENHPI